MRSPQEMVNHGKHQPTMTQQNFLISQKHYMHLKNKWQGPPEKIMVHLGRGHKDKKG